MHDASQGKGVCGCEQATSTCRCFCPPLVSNFKPLVLFLTISWKRVSCMPYQHSSPYIIIYIPIHISHHVHTSMIVHVFSKKQLTKLNFHRKKGKSTRLKRVKDLKERGKGPQNRVPSNLSFPSTRPPRDKIHPLN